MISISGFSAVNGLAIVDRTRDAQLESLKNQPQHQRAIENFYEKISDVETVDQLMEDYELYSFVMKAYDLEDQIFGKAMMSKILKSNVEESDALINRMTDPRFRELYDDMGFGTDGVGNLNTILSSWQDRMVDRYVERHFINFQTEGNETVGSVLEFRNKVGDINNAFDILKDSQLTSFFQKALGLPSSVSGLDIDKQAELLESKLDIESLQDPEVADKLVRKFVAISDALNNTATSNNIALQLISPIGSSSQIVTGTIGISAINFSGY